MVHTFKVNDKVFTNQQVADAKWVHHAYDMFDHLPPCEFEHMVHGNMI